MSRRLSMFAWKVRCAWCDVKLAFGYLAGADPLPSPLSGSGGTGCVDGGTRFVGDGGTVI